MSVTWISLSRSGRDLLAWACADYDAHLAYLQGHPDETACEFCRASTWGKGTVKDKDHPAGREESDAEQQARVLAAHEEYTALLLPQPVQEIDLAALGVDVATPADTAARVKAAAAEIEV